MNKELEQRLVERWPNWFNTAGDLRVTVMPLGFVLGDGWINILWKLCEDLEPLVTEFEAATGHKFDVLQVKEKFGGLRVHVNEASEAIRMRIEVAVQESFLTCEVCGQPGERRGTDWVNTLCDNHASANTFETR